MAVKRTTTTDNSLRSIEWDEELKTPLDFFKLNRSMAFIGSFVDSAGGINYNEVIVSLNSLSG